MAGKKYSVQLVLRAKDLVSSAFAKVGRGLKAFGRGLALPVQRIARIGSAVSGFIRHVPGIHFLGAAVARVGGFLADAAQHASDVGSAFNDLTARTGIAPKVLQEVAYAADQAGVPLQEFTSGVQRMSAVLGRQLKPQQFRMLGREASAFVRAIKGKSATEQFEAVLSMMTRIPKASERAAFAQIFFGKAGVKLAAIAGDGAEALAKVRRETEELGLIMSDEAIQQADAFGDTWAALGKVWASLKTDFGSGLIEGLLPEMQELLTKFKENRAAVREFVRDLGQKIGTGVVDTVKGIADGLKWIIENKGLVMGAAAAMGAAFIASLGPVGAALAVITAAIAGVIKALTDWADQTKGERKEATAKAMTISDRHRGFLDAIAGPGTHQWWNQNMDEMGREGAAEVATEKAQGALITAAAIQNNMRGSAAVAASESDRRSANGRGLWGPMGATDTGHKMSQVSADFGRYAYMVVAGGSDRQGGLGGQLAIDVNINPKGDYSALFATPTATVTKAPANTQTKVNTGKRTTSHAKGG